jgi:RHS repeat-associated protein
MKNQYRTVNIWLILFAITTSVVMASVGTCFAATSCDPQGGITTIGLEWTAYQCIPEGTNDNSSIYYINNMIECNGSSVVLSAYYGDTTTTPVNLINSWKNQGYRVLRNKEGTHIVAVHRYYTGLIDGKDMDAYPAYNSYTDVLTSAMIPPSPTPDCRGGDFNIGCSAEQPANSSVNTGTGRLSHSQELFTTRSGQPLALSASLFYRSMPVAPGAIGSGWSHGYEMTLVSGTGSSMVFWLNGTRRVYNNYNSSYVSPKGDFSSLVKNADSTWTITEKDGLKRNFDTTGQVTSLFDRNGNTLSFTYTVGRLAGVSDPNGRSAAFAYDSNGKLSVITDPRGNVYTLTYSGGKLAGISYPDTGSWAYTYGGNGLLATKVDPENNTFTYNNFDANNRLLSTTDPVGNVRSYAYPVLAAPGKVPDAYPATAVQQKVLTFTEKDGNGWNYTYDTLTENVLSKTDPLGNVTSYTYDTRGNMLTKAEPGIGTTIYTFDSKGNILTAKDPLNQTTSYTYNAFGQVLTTTGAPGTSSNTYDAKGNLLTSTDPSGALTQFGYDSKGNLISTTDARNKVTTRSYDATTNNLLSITLPTTAVTRFTYDAHGNLLTVTDANNKITTYTHDSRDRLLSITDPLGNATTFTYDKNGNQATLKDANNKTTTFTYNFQGQLSSAKDALNSVTGFTYGVPGCPSCTGIDKLTTLTDAKNQKTTWSYDKIGRVVSETDPLNYSTSYTYGATKSPTTKTGGNNAAIAYTYDSLQRLTRKTYPDTTTENYTYDSRNNILTAGNLNVSYVFTYDGANRIKSVSDNRGYVVTYDYDVSGNRTRMVLQPGTANERVTTYSYDDGSRLATILSPSGTYTFGYDLNNRRVSLIYPNQITATSVYDDAGRLTGIFHAKPDNSIIASAAYTLDGVGNRIAKSGTANETYVYDSVYRILQAATLRGAETFSYDAVGNRISGPGPRDTLYQYDAGNRMTRGRQLNYSFDNNGNQTIKTISGTTDRTWVQSWNAENRLVKVEKTKGSEKRTVTFLYDPFGRRIEKRLETTLEGVIKVGTWRYFYDQNSIALEIFTNEDGVIEKTTYTHGLDVDEHLALERNGNYYYYHADGLGSITAFTNSARSTVQTYEYESYGMVNQGTSFRNTFTYTGREWDKETGLYYYRARFYDPMEGRFISKDPIGFAGGINLYSYVGQNSINRTDPTGLEWRNGSYNYSDAELMVLEERVGRVGHSMAEVAEIHDTIDKSILLDLPKALIDFINYLKNKKNKEKKCEESKPSIFDKYYFGL